MRFNKYYSGTDEGTEAVIQAIALQPETVLGLLVISYDRLSGLGAYPLAEFVYNYEIELSKYQIAILLSHACRDIFDTQATLFHPRYPAEWLTQLNLLVPDVAVHHFGAVYLPKGVQDVTGFHSRTFDQDREWVTGYGTEGLKESCEGVIADGYKNKKGALELRRGYIRAACEVARERLGKRRSEL